MSFILLWDDELWTCCLLWFRAAGLKNISSGCLRLLNKADYDKNNQLLSCHVSFSGFHQHTLFFHVLLILKHLQHLLLKSRLASTESSHIWPPSRPRESRQRLSPLKATHHMCVHDGHAVKISLFPSPQRKETALFQRSPRGGAVGSFTCLWFYCKTSLFLRWLCVRQQEKLVWDLLAVTDLQMMDKCPSGAWVL